MGYVTENHMQDTGKVKNKKESYADNRKVGVNRRLGKSSTERQL